MPSNRTTAEPAGRDGKPAATDPGPAPSPAARRQRSAESRPAGAAATGERLDIGLHHGIVAAAAAIVAWKTAGWLGLPESFWSAITAIVVVQTQINAIGAIARDQFAGALVGGAAGALVAVLFGMHGWSYVVALVVAIVVSWGLNLGSAAKLSGVTVTIILLVPLKASLGEILFSRISEVVWGVLVAVIFVKAWEWAKPHLPAALAPPAS